MKKEGTRNAGKEKRKEVRKEGGKKAGINECTEDKRGE